MTSSAKHLKAGQARWDYSIQRYKDNRDVFFEPGLFSIIVLAHGRHDMTKQTALETVKNVSLYDGEVEWLFIENGHCDDNARFFDSLNLERKVVVRQSNFGINQGINQGWALSRGEYVMILENDWQTKVNQNFLRTAKDIFEQQSDIGIIQLRDPRDPNENHGLGKPLFNPWTCDPQECNKLGITIDRLQTANGHTFLVANHPNGFNNNPILIRKRIYRECGPYPEPIISSDPRHGETEYQKRVSLTHWLTAYIGIPLYQHSGRVQTVTS